MFHIGIKWIEFMATLQIHDVDDKYGNKHPPTHLKHRLIKMLDMSHLSTSLERLMSNFIRRKRPNQAVFFHANQNYFTI